MVLRISPCTCGYCIEPEVLRQRGFQWSAELASIIRSSFLEIVCRAKTRRKSGFGTTFPECVLSLVEN